MLTLLALLITDDRPPGLKGDLYIKTQRVPLDFSSRWFFLHLINITFSQFEILQNIKINPRHIIGPRWCRIFLNPFEVSKINSSDNFNLFQIPDSEKLEAENISKDIVDFIVIADKIFEESIVEYTKITDEIYSVRNTNINFLINNPSVLKIYPNPNFSKFNIISVPILQNGRNTFTGPEVDFSEDRAELRTREIDGRGVTVTIIDSGLNIKHPFFNDENVNITPSIFSDTHRKIARYDPIIDNIDIENGHGTFCAGVIAGSIENCNILKNMRDMLPVQDYTS